MAVAANLCRFPGVVLKYSIIQRSNYSSDFLRALDQFKLAEAVEAGMPQKQILVFWRFFAEKIEFPNAPRAVGFRVGRTAAGAGRFDLQIAATRRWAFRGSDANIFFIFFLITMI